MGGAALTGIAALRIPRRAWAALAAARDAASRWRPLASGSVPRAFTSGELAALERLVERILPETDTPGAAAAGVHWYLDDAAEVEPQTLERLRGCLARLEQRAREGLGKGFAEASEAEQDRVLLAISGEQATREERALFEFARARVVEGYYRSEAGQLGELQWVGHEFFDRFPGACTHADPKAHPRPGWRESRRRKRA